jgi:hypothetical protein
MSKLRNNPLTKILGPFFLEKWSKTTKKQVFLAFLAICGPFGYPQMSPKRYSQACKREGCMAECVNLKKPLTKSGGMV